MPKLTSLLGLFFIIGVAWLLSTDRKRISKRVIVGGLLLQFAFGFLTVFFRLFFHLPQSRIAQKKSDEFMNCPLRFLALRGNEHFQFSGVSDRFAEIVVFVSFRLPPRVFVE